ncbi:StAR related lipid transfer domain containing 5 [Rhinolophus ferrumequinum]|uniref:StAR related lipid transfer domain containing 5 n=1 Tax=Rhinolophus ferrumequinum TaxID=59479 RepID=A0A7J7RB60_RHIFE|nr:StAR related lipid transfer domain containing 5 [Rhinolophus ferrumequinum]
MGEAVARKVLRYRRDEPGWKICREGNGVSVSWRPSVESRGPQVPRGRCVWGLVKPLPGSLREKWEENVTSSEIIQSITDVSLSRHCSPQIVTCPCPLGGGGLDTF